MRIAEQVADLPTSGFTPVTCYVIKFTKKWIEYVNVCSILGLVFAEELIE